VPPPDRGVAAGLQIEADQLGLNGTTGSSVEKRRKHPDLLLGPSQKRGLLFGLRVD
jgi:hypothetical protein